MSIITVGISDLAVSKAPDVICTYALGSCVGICLYDEANKIGGLVHIMLPSSKEAPHIHDNLKKFADTGIKMLVMEIERAGGNVRNLKAKIAGGAQMFAGVSSFNIGERNVKSVKQILSDGDLPFNDNIFDLIINRHDSYDVNEIKRILKPDGGVYLVDFAHLKAEKSILIRATTLTVPTSICHRPI